MLRTILLNIAAVIFYTSPAWIFYCFAWFWDEHVKRLPRTVEELEAKTGMSHREITYDVFRKFYPLFILAILAAPVNALSTGSVAQMETDLRQPQSPESNITNTNNEPVQPTGVSDFAASPFKLGSQTAQIPTRTRLRMVVETPISAETAQIGDSFKAKVTEDYYLEGDYRKLIIPKSSWIRGKVSVVKRPRLLSRSGKLAIKLDSLVTPTGDYVPLDADLSFMEGIVNFEGVLDPQTDFGDKAMVPTQKLLSTDKGKIFSVATAGIPVAGSLLAGSVVALFSHGDPASVTKGQELQIMITRDTDLGL